MDRYLARIQAYGIMALVFHFYNEDWGHEWGGLAALIMIIGVVVLGDLAVTRTEES